VARIFLFALEELRHRFGHLTPEGADPRHDATAFRAFRDALLARAAPAARAPAALSMWWEGTYNGYALAVACEPADALAGFDPTPACPCDDERVAPPRDGRHPLATLAPGAGAVARDAAGAAWEAPFGAATGHFGAPGMRRAPASPPEEEPGPPGRA
jgi:hypothetical protein